MEIEGHPTQDLLEELEARGAIRLRGTSTGPNEEAVRFISERLPDTTGYWMFLPSETFMTGVDDVPV